MESPDMTSTSSSTVAQFSVANPISAAGEISSGAVASTVDMPLPASTSIAASAAATSSSVSDCTTGTIPSSTAVLGRDAASLFQCGRFQDCLDILHQILNKEEDNVKVLHNIAVAQYFNGGCTDPQKLLDDLANIKKRREELPKHVGEQVIGTNSTLNSSSNAVLSSSKASISIDVTACVEDNDISISTYNSAVVLYNLQQYAAALSLLKPLYQNIEPIDESAALRICLLMLDITLASCQLRKAADVFQYMERVFGSGYFVPTAESGCGELSQPTSTSNTSDSAAAGGNLGSSLSFPAAETSFNSEDGLEEECLGFSMDLEGSQLMTSSAHVTVPQGTVRDRELGTPRDSSVKILLQLYKVRLLLCVGNIKAAKREVKMAMNSARGHYGIIALLLKAQLEYLRRNHRKAVKLLTTCSSKEPGMRNIFLNNLGCIHHELRKDHLAYLYLMKALQSDAMIGVEKPLKLSTFSKDRSLSVLYNCGLQQLRNGKPTLAARCLQDASPLYYNQPLLWLRLAESCILALENGLLEVGGYDASIQKDELRVHLYGKGRWRKFIFPDGGLNPCLSKHIVEMKFEDPEDNAVKFTNFTPGVPFQLSLVFARQCLHNAMHLLKSINSKSQDEVAETPVSEEVAQDAKNNTSASRSEGSKGINPFLPTSSSGNVRETKGHSTSTILTSVLAYEEERVKQKSFIMQYVLADLAFIELCLENPIRALRVSERLLQSECVKPFKLLGHMYAAEALCLMGRPKEAATYLSACISETSSFDFMLNGGDEDGRKWKSGDNSEGSVEGDDGVICSNTLASIPDALSISSLSGTQARASLFVNLAIVNALQGELSQAHQFAMQAFSIMPANPLTVLSIIYVELLQGKMQEVVMQLKQCRHLCVMNSKKY